MVPTQPRGYIPQGSGFAHWPLFPEPGVCEGLMTGNGGGHWGYHQMMVDKKRNQLPSL